jgi:hypothetical protein
MSCENDEISFHLLYKGPRSTGPRSSSGKGLVLQVAATQQHSVLEKIMVMMFMMVVVLIVSLLLPLPPLLLSSLPRCGSQPHLLSVLPGHQAWCLGPDRATQQRRKVQPAEHDAAGPPELLWTPSMLKRQTW